MVEQMCLFDEVPTWRIDNSCWVCGNNIIAETCGKFHAYRSEYNGRPWPGDHTFYDLGWFDDLKDAQAAAMSFTAKVGDHVHDHGVAVEWDDLERYHVYVCDCSTESHVWLKLVRIVGFAKAVDGDGRRVRFSSDPKKDGLANMSELTYKKNPLYAIR